MSWLHDRLEIELEILAIPQNPNWLPTIRQAFQMFNIVSPPEQLFFAGWYFLPSEPLLHPQKWIEDYRVDFWVETTPYVVEIDGRWHRESVAQIEADFKRDRAILKANYRIIRFSTGEIFRNVYGCVETVQELLGAPHAAAAV